MNPATLHPIVLEKLQRFARQRRRLILWRGLCGTAAVWLAAMTLLALADRFIVLADEWRLALSVAGYAATAAIFWLTCGRHLAQIPGPRELARLVEAAAPQLREELLAAVELAESGHRPHWDSDQFRAALQELVARDVGHLQVESLLTRRLIAAWLYAAGGVLLVFLLLLCVPGLRFTQWFARAVLPAANIERVSDVQITVVAPEPPDQILPQGDNVPITVKLSGADTEKVLLETFPKRGHRERVMMTLSGPRQFTASIQLGQQPVQYRIRANDAITRKFTLDPRARPQAVRFQKTYHYPSYSQWPPKTVTEENGDLEALEGTEVELNIEVDQPTKQAVLRLELGKTKKDIPLTSTGQRRLSARLPLTVSGTYQVHLVAAETSFDNKYSPQYEIRVHPDLLPSVKIDLPDKEQLVLPPDAVVALAGTAKDDLAVSRVEQMVQINRGHWQSIPLVQSNSPQLQVTRSWDLFQLGVHPGDRVLTKLTATDLKGQRAESAPLRIMITTPGFDPQRHKRLQAKQEVDKALQELRQAADILDQQTHKTHETLANTAADKLAKQQALLAARAAAENLQQKTAETQRKIQETLPQMTSARESSDLALAAAALSRAQRDGLPQLQNALEQAADQLASGDDKAAKEALKQNQEHLNNSVGAIRAANDAFRQLLAAEEANAAATDLAQIAAEQRALAEMLRDPTQAERVARRQSVTADQVKEVEQQMNSLAQHTWDWPANTARDQAKTLATHRENLEKNLAAEPSADKLRPASEALQHSVENAAQNMRNAERELAKRADNARQWLQNQFGNPADTLTQLARQLERRNRSPITPQQWEAAAAQLKDHAAIEEKRPHPDAQFVADTANAADALMALGDIHQASPTNALPALRKLEEAYRKLQTGHRLAEQLPALHQLAAKERWEKPTPAETTERARDWKWSQQQLQSLPPQLEQAKLPADAARALDQIAKSQPAQQVGNEMNQRQNTATPDKNVATPLHQLASQVADVTKQLQPILDEARAELAQATPKLSDRLAALAQSAEKIKQKTDAHAQEAGKPETTETIRAEATKLAHEQQKLDNRVNDARDAIRRDANSQNLATEQGRERARDADDALAMLRQPTPDAHDMLQHAAQTQQPDKQQVALKNAAEQQSKLANTLKQLAEHYKNLDQGKTEPTRSALREAEKEQGLKATLDAEYAKAEALQQLAGMSPQEQLKELEKALQTSKPMRAELSDIAKNTLHNAAADLQQSAQKEQNIARQMASPAEQAKQIAETAKKLAQQDIPATAQQAGENARPDLNNAAQKLDNVAHNIPQDFSKKPSELAQAMQAQVAPLQQAATDLHNAANKADQAAKPKAQAAAQQAAQLAQQAQQLANALQQIPAQMQAAAGQQPAIEQTVREAGNNIERAGRHEERLGNQPMGQQLQHLGNQIENQTGAQLAEAGKEMNRASTPSQLHPPAQGAAEAIQKPLDQVNAMLQQPTPTPPTPPATDLSGQLASAQGETAQWMARALDSLDAAMHPASAPAGSESGQPGQSPSQQGQPNQGQQAQSGQPQPGQSQSQGQPSPSAQAAQSLAAQAAQAAAQSQAVSMMSARNQGLTPGQQPFSEANGQGNGAAFNAAGMDVGALPDVPGIARADWGKLPPKLARDLLESRREGVAGEYREMVDLYFRAIATKAREKK